MIQGVLFDFFGTLVDYDRVRMSQTYQATFEILLSLGVRDSYDDFVECVEQQFEAFLHESQKSQNEFSMLEVLRAVTVGFDVPVSLAELNQLAESYTLEWARSVTPIKGVKQFLSSLSRRFRLGLITNTHHAPMVHRLLREMAITNVFELVLTSVEYGKPKPHPGIFHDALTRMNLQASEAVFVGDSYPADYQGALGAGINCYLVGKHARVPVEYQIPTVLDLPLYRLK